jgi:hypothetical protein
MLSFQVDGRGGRGGVVVLGGLERLGLGRGQPWCVPAIANVLLLHADSSQRTSRCLAPPAAG